MTIRSRIERLEKKYGNSGLGGGVVRWLWRTGGFEYRGDHYKRWADLPQGCYLLIPEPAKTAEEWVSREKEPTFAKDWGKMIENV